MSDSASNHRWGHYLQVEGLSLCHQPSTATSSLQDLWSVSLRDSWRSSWGATTTHKQLQDLEAACPFVIEETISKAPHTAIYPQRLCVVCLPAFHMCGTVVQMLCSKLWKSFPFFSFMTKNKSGRVRIEVMAMKWFIENMFTEKRALISPTEWSQQWKTVSEMDLYETNLCIGREHCYCIPCNIMDEPQYTYPDNE